MKGTILKDEKRTYRKKSDQFGELIEGTSQVYCEFEPRDATTYQALAFWLAELGIQPKRDSSLLKYIRALSDVCMAVQASVDGRVFWPSGNDELNGPYTMKIARPLRKALTGRYLTKVQPSSKKDRLCAIYEIKLPDFGHPLRFKPHGLSPAIRVRSPKIRRAGKLTGGNNVGLKRFDQELVYRLQDEVRTIRSCMKQHPLTHPNGSKFSSITRIFHNANLNHGGRSYANYQNYPENERLTMKIDGESVCEIDIKSCYLAIIAGRHGVSLPNDPYAELPYIKNKKGEDFTIGRKLMKLMLSKIISVDGEPTKFPKGEERTTEDGERKTVSIKEIYSIPSKVTAKNIFSDIYTTYPFLRQSELSVFDLMKIESDIMTATMLQLALDDIPSYPVHDCLICKASDENEVLKALRNNLTNYIKSTPAIDITYADGSSKMINSAYPEGSIKYDEYNKYIHQKEEDFSVIDEEDSMNIRQASKSIEEQKSDPGQGFPPPSCLKYLNSPVQGKS